MEIRIGYPSPGQEEEIVMRTTSGDAKLPEAALTRDEFLQLRDLVLAVPVARNVAAAAVQLCGASRPDDPRAAPMVKDYVAWGAGPRGSQNLVLAAKAGAVSRTMRPSAGRPAGGRPADPAAPHHRQSPGRGRFGRLSRFDRGAIEEPMNAHRRFLDLRALAALERMRFTTRHRIEGSYSGCHTSRQQGGSGEFVDYREYSGGEDLRRLDWKVLGRSGKTFVRIHEEETNLLCTLALDTSGSMDFRGVLKRDGSKLEYAQYLATALAHVITSGQDQVGLALLGEHLRETLPPG